MRLGQALWRIGLPEEEKSRISSALADESSINFKVFTDHYRGQKLFDSICRKMVRKIPGFRPTAAPFRKRVHAEILKSLRNNNAKPDFWNLYTACVADFIVSNLSALNQLLADTELPEQFEVTTESILSEITDRAAEYSVHDRDVTTLYELWPFERVSNMPEYLSKCPKFDRFRALDESIKSVEARMAREISDLKQHASDDIADIRGILQTKVLAKDDFKESTQSSKREFDHAIKLLAERINALEQEKDRIQKLARRVEARRVAESRRSAAEQSKELDNLRQSLNQLKNQQERISEIIEELPSSASQSTFQSIPSGDSRRSPFSLLEQRSSTENLDKLDVREALTRFVKLTAKGESTPPGNEELFFYTALLANCILVVDRPQLRIWESIVGWDRNKVTACASPLWVDEFSISEGLFWLFDEPEEPRSLEIHDFDLGYVDGYLGPFLKAWSQSTFQLPWKKIYLIPSGSAWSLSNRVAALVSVLPKVDFDSTVLSGSTSSEPSTVPSLRVRKFMKKHGIAIPSQIDVQDSIDVLESAEAGLLSPAELLQTKIISSTSLPKELKSRFAAELVMFWSERLGE